jgi:hypothetical protein
MATPNEKNEVQHVDEKVDSIYAPKQHQMVQIDNVQVLGLDPADADFYINFSDERRKKVIHKVRLIRLICAHNYLLLTRSRSIFVLCLCWLFSTSSRTLIEPTLG